MKRISYKTYVFFGSIVIFLLSVLGIKDLVFFQMSIVLSVYLFILIHLYRQKAQILDFGVILAAMGSLYILGPTIAVIFGKIEKDEYYEHSQLILYSILCLCFFYLGYRYKLINRKICKANNTHKKTLGFIQKHNHSIIKIALIVVLVVFILSQFLIISGVGLSSYFTIGRAATKLVITTKYAKLSMFTGLGNFVNTFALILFLEERKRKKFDYVYFSIFIVSGVMAILLAIISMDRSTLLLIILPFIYVLHFYKIINTKMVIASGITMVFLFVIWKGSLSRFLKTGSIGITKRDISIPTEIYIWFEVGSNIIDALKNEEINYYCGYTYLRAFESIINPLFQNYDSLSTWYMKTFETALYLKGSGRAFSCIVESYLNFNILGSVLVFFPMGIFYKTIEAKTYTSIYWRCYYALSLAYIYKIFRSEAYSIIKMSFWTWGVPLLIIYFFDCKYKSTHKQKVIGKLS